jgi:hypothetical protein
MNSKADERTPTRRRLSAVYFSPKNIEFFARSQNFLAAGREAHKMVDEAEVNGKAHGTVMMEYFSPNADTVHFYIFSPSMSCLKSLCSGTGVNIFHLSLSRGFSQSDSSALQSQKMKKKSRKKTKKSDRRRRRESRDEQEESKKKSVTTIE